MKPPPFQLHRPTAVEDALALLAEHGEEAVVMAGGQSLTPLLNMRMVRPSVVVYLGGVAGLDGIAADGGGATFGAMCRSRAAELSPAVRAAVPALPEALSYVGHPQIRNQGTIGGMVAFADPAAEIPAVLVACEGWVRLRSASGSREVAAADFFEGFYSTACAKDELVTEVHFDGPGEYRFAVEEYARRHGDYALAGAVVGARLSGGRVEGLRLCYFGVGAVPVRLRELEQSFAGQPFDEVVEGIGDRVAEQLSPPSDVHATADYRRWIAAVLTTRALRALESEGAA